MKSQRKTTPPRSPRIPQNPSHKPNSETTLEEKPPPPSIRKPPSSQPLPPQTQELTLEVQGNNETTSSRDPNEDFCRFCKAAGELICCERCPSAWHFYCLTPPLKDTPTGIWFCPLCDVNRVSIKPILLTKMSLNESSKEKRDVERNRMKKKRRKKLERILLVLGWTVWQW
jgi:hypothetical protein